jgi:hypothetical protein
MVPVEGLAAYDSLIPSQSRSTLYSYNSVQSPLHDNYEPTDCNELIEMAGNSLVPTEKLSFASTTLGLTSTDQ